MFLEQREDARCFTDGMREWYQDELGDAREFLEIMYGKIVNVELSYEGMIHLAK